MTTKPTKAQIREEIKRQVERYLSEGGEVRKIPNGLSGNESNTNLFQQATQFEPRKERTPLTEVLKALDARKSSKTPAKRIDMRKPRKKLVTDDFGEPLRWVWDDS